MIVRLLATLLVLVVLPTCGPRGPRLNLVVIVADDLGFGDLGCYGGSLPTPHIDTLARDGVRFTQAYACAPTCGPSRAGILTGRYPQRFGFEFNPGPRARALADPDVGLPADEVTVTEDLRRLGYRTAMIGKWHLGMAAEHHPLQRGFDHFFGFRFGAAPYAAADRADVHTAEVSGTRMALEPFPQDALERDGQPVDEPDYLTDAFAREAVAFIEQTDAEPFFLYLSFSAPHTPFQVTDRYYERFPGIADEPARVFAGMLSALDDAVGRVLDALARRGLDDRTLVLFASDNGGSTYTGGGSNGQLRGGKGMLFEGGIRVPLLLRLADRQGAGSTCDGVASLLDISTTLLAAAGGRPTRPQDGVDLLPFARGEPSAPPHATLFWRAGSNLAIRSGPYKLWKAGDDAVWLFDLDADPGETRNLASGNTELLRGLLHDYAAWDRTLRRPRWPGQPTPIDIDGKRIQLYL